MKNYFLLSIVSLFLFWSCDKIDNPIPEGLGNTIRLDSNIEYIVDPSLNITTASELENLLANSNWGDSIVSPNNSTQRFIVIEEFTGHTCINCIPGTKEIVRLDSIYGDQLIPIGIHAGTFAELRPPKYIVDFRPPSGFGETIFDEFNPEKANPRGVVNRQTTAAGNAKSLSEWSKDIKLVENDAPVASLQIKNFFDSSAKILRTNLEIEWLVTRPESYNVQLQVLEDHIIAYQKDAQDPRIDIPDYDHRHVLRKFVNGERGKQLDTANVNSTEIIEYIYPMIETLQPNNNKNVEVVAFIYFQDGGTTEIVQGNAAYIVNK